MTGVLIAANGVLVMVVPNRLPATYGITLGDPNLVVLLRHRAVMLALIGTLVVASAAHPPWRVPAVVCALVSVGSFVVYASSADGINAENLRTAVIDVVLLALLIAIGVLLHFVL